MILKPKPKRLERQRKRRKLWAWRKQVNFLVLAADKYICQHCQMRQANHAHHVYGRGNSPEHWKEQPEARLSLCNGCHFRHHHQGGLSREELAEDLERAVAERCN